MALAAPPPSEIPLDYGHTCINHFAVLDLRHGAAFAAPQLTRLAMTLCSSPLVDDTLLLERSEVADARLRILGGDGREADFCANGLIYLAARIGTELGRDQVAIETAAGVRRARREGEKWLVEVGEARPLGHELADSARQRLADLPLLGVLRAGEPHLVLGLPTGLAGFHIERTVFEDYCTPFRDVTDIPGGVNVTMVFQQDSDSVLIRTFERGVKRHTLSCGTGAVSAIAAVFGTPTSDRAFHVCSPGGMHDVRFIADRWHVAAVPERIGMGFVSENEIRLPLAGLAAYAGA